MIDICLCLNFQFYEIKYFSENVADGEPSSGSTCLFSSL